LAWLKPCPDTKLGSLRFKAGSSFFLSGGLCMAEGTAMLWNCFVMDWQKGELQIPPLRFASVGTTRWGSLAMEDGWEDLKDCSG
jgi:hypothetical protein